MKPFILLRYTSSEGKMAKFMYMYLVNTFIKTRYFNKYPIYIFNDFHSVLVSAEIKM